MKLDIDFSQFKSIFDKLTSQYKEGLSDGMDAVAEYAQNHAKNTPLFKHNGANGLRSSIQIERNGDYGRTIFSDKHYARYVEEGRPGFSAKNAKCLRFVINGEVIFRKSVGPQAPKPFMANARNAAQAEASHLIHLAIANRMKS